VPDLYARDFPRFRTLNHIWTYYIEQPWISLPRPRQGNIDYNVSTVVYNRYIYIYICWTSKNNICQPGFRMTPVLSKGVWTQPNFKHLQSQARHRMSPPSSLFLHPPKLVRLSATPPEEKCPDMTRPSNECSDLFLYFPGESWRFWGFRVAMAHSISEWKTHVPHMVVDGGYPFTFDFSIRVWRCINIGHIFLCAL
jgi:hypothetical protein